MQLIRSRSLQRYCPQIPFPPYRHIPGATFHPRTHPSGHSYGAAERDSPPLTEENWCANEAYLFGVDLFNYAYWWEAHEEWESLWNLAERQALSRIYLQGLIQTAAALVKWREGNERGVVKLWRQAREKLVRVGGESPVYMGLDIAELVGCVEPNLVGTDRSCAVLIRLYI